MAKKPQFVSRIGLIAATVGSAVGLGNIWRFPAETQENGGAAFLLIYVLCVFLLGIPVMLGEFAVGRAGRSDAVGAFKNLGAKRGWWSIGLLGVLASYMIICFYMVVAGWTFEYLCHSVTGTLYEGFDPAGANNFFTARMSEYISAPVSPMINTFVMIAITGAILLVGVEKGIERMSNILMPTLFVILLIFMIVALTFPGAYEGLSFFFHPDFTKITPMVALNALGQAFFSLSLGMGILITYASYYPKETRLVKTAVTVSLLDLLVAVMMGVIIFPAVMTFHLEGEGLEGATLVFVTLPEVFTKMPGTQLWSILFFLLLTVAALTSCISIAEVTVAFIRDRFHVGRVGACLITLCPLLLFSTLCSLSQGPLSDFLICGRNIFDFLDFTATNLLLPVGSLLLCVWLGWFAPKDLLQRQLTNEGTLAPSAVNRVVAFLMKWIAPLLIMLVLLSAFL